MKKIRGSRSIPTLLKPLLGLLLACLLTFALMDWLVMPAYTRHGKETLLPRVVGLDVTRARAVLASLGFEVEVEHRKADPAGRFKADEVIEQFPRGGALTKSARTVHLTLSAGQSAFPLPDLTGQGERQAGMLLADLGLQLDTTATRWEFAELEAGLVLSQVPAPAHKVNRGTKVRLVLSLGPIPESVLVPGLLGSGLEAASRRLQSVGLTLGSVEEEHHPGRPRGIRAQVPVAGSRLAPGESVSVRLNVAGGRDKTSEDPE